MGSSRMASKTNNKSTSTVEEWKQSLSVPNLAAENHTFTSDVTGKTYTFTEFDVANAAAKASLDKHTKIGADKIDSEHEDAFTDIKPKVPQKEPII